MQLCSYIEGKTNLTLPTFRCTLRCHYQEKSPTDLYKQLSSEVQGAQETPQNAVIRALDSRQKFLFALQESESGLKYDPSLAQNMFLHTVLTAKTCNLTCKGLCAHSMHDPPNCVPKPHCIRHSKLWSEQCQQVCEAVKAVLTNAPVLAAPVFGSVAPSSSRWTPVSRVRPRPPSGWC